MSWGAPEEMTVIPTSDQYRTKESSGYKVSGAEGDEETPTTTYPCNKARVGISYVT